MIKFLFSLVGIIFFTTWVLPYLYVLASWKNEAIIAIIDIGLLSPMAVGAIVTALSLSLMLKIFSLF